MEPVQIEIERHYEREKLLNAILDALRNLQEQHFVVVQTVTTLKEGK